jgi:hypothetical protein
MTKGVHLNIAADNYNNGTASTEELSELVRFLATVVIHRGGCDCGVPLRYTRMHADDCPYLLVKRILKK